MQRLNNSQQGRKIILESARRELVDELNAETPHRLSEIPVEEAKAAMLEARMSLLPSCPAELIMPVY
jgi:hypothetical protein